MTPLLNVHVHLPRGSDVAGSRQRYDRGETPNYTPYDFHLAERPGVAVTFSADRDRARPGRLVGAINRRLHFDIAHAWANRHAIEGSDVVWTMSEGEAIAVAALMAMRIVPRRPIVGTAIWLFGNWPMLPRHARALYRRLSGYLDTLLVHSAKSLEIAQRVRLRCPVEFCAFGVNERAFAPLPEPAMAPGRPIRVLAAGNDLTRDWPTLLDACGNDERFALSVWTPALTEADRRRVGNLALPKPTTVDAIRQLYADADVVVVPMHDNVYSGITVALEAAAQLRPLVSSRTGGVPAYFDETQVRYVAPGDADALRQAIAEAGANGLYGNARRARQRFVEAAYTTGGVMERFLAVTDRALKRSGTARKT